MVNFTFIPGTDGLMAPVVYFIDSNASSLQIIYPQSSFRFNIIQLNTADWNNDLSPWFAPRLSDRDKEDFAGNGSAYLNTILSQQIPEIEKALGLTPSTCAIAGYSMAGLFSLYAAISTDAFSAVAAISPSLWFDTWDTFVKETSVSPSLKFAFISLGTKERRAPNKRMRTVADNEKITEQALESQGVTVEFSSGPGNHFQHMETRITTALTSLENFFKTSPEFYS